MASKRYLKKFNANYISVAREIYQDGVQSLELDLYSQEQINAWSSISYLPGVLDRPLDQGRGWVSCLENEIEAFGLRYPLNRLALLYCRGRSFGQGHATAILQRIELEAMNEGQESLLTEASLCSYPLLRRLGWRMIKPQKILIGGVSFDRYLMKRQLNK